MFHFQRYLGQVVRLHETDSEIIFFYKYFLSWNEAWKKKIMLHDLHKWKNLIIYLEIEISFSETSLDDLVKLCCCLSSCWRWLLTVNWLEYMEWLYFREKASTAQELLLPPPPPRLSTFMCSFFFFFPFRVFSAHAVLNAGKAILDPKTSGHLVFLRTSKHFTLEYQKCIFSTILFPWWAFRILQAIWMSLSVS